MGDPRRAGSTRKAPSDRRQWSQHWRTSSSRAHPVRANHARTSRIDSSQHPLPLCPRRPSSPVHEYSLMPSRLLVQLPLATQTIHFSGCSATAFGISDVGRELGRPTPVLSSPHLAQWLVTFVKRSLPCVDTPPRDLKLALRRAATARRGPGGVPSAAVGNPNPTPSGRTSSAGIRRCPWSARAVGPADQAAGLAAGQPGPLRTTARAAAAVHTWLEAAGIADGPSCARSAAVTEPSPPAPARTPRTACVPGSSPTRTCAERRIGRSHTRPGTAPWPRSGCTCGSTKPGRTTPPPCSGCSPGRASRWMSASGSATSRKRRDLVASP